MASKEIVTSLARRGAHLVLGSLEDELAAEESEIPI